MELACLPAPPAPALRAAAAAVPGRRVTGARCRDPLAPARFLSLSHKPSPRAPRSPPSAAVAEDWRGGEGG